MQFVHKHSEYTIYQCLFKTEKILIGMKAIIKLIPSHDSANKFEYTSFRTLDPHIKKILYVTSNSL